MKINIYLFRVSKIRDRLNNSDLPSEAFLNHFIAAAILGPFGLPLFFGLSPLICASTLESLNIEDLFYGTAQVLTIFLGLSFLYLANNGIIGRQFVLRVVSLSLPISIKWGFIIIVIAFILNYLNIFVFPAFFEAVDSKFLFIIYQVYFAAIKPLLYFLYYVSIYYEIYLNLKLLTKSHDIEEVALHPEIRDLKLRSESVFSFLKKLFMFCLKLPVDQYRYKTSLMQKTPLYFIAYCSLGGLITLPVFPIIIYFFFSIDLDNSGALLYSSYIFMVLEGVVFVIILTWGLRRCHENSILKPEVDFYDSFYVFFLPKIVRWALRLYLFVIVYTTITALVLLYSHFDIGGFPAYYYYINSILMITLGILISHRVLSETASSIETSHMKVGI